MKKKKKKSSNLDIEQGATFASLFGNQGSALLSVSGTKKKKKKKKKSPLEIAKALGSDPKKEKKHESEIRKLFKSALSSQSRAPIDFKIDDRELPEFPNFWEYCTSNQGLGTQPFPRQLWMLINLFAEWCPRCSDPKMRDVEGIAVDENLYDCIGTRLVLLHHGKCIKCKGRRSKFVMKERLNLYQELNACVTGDAIVPTSEGLLRLDEMRADIQVNSGASIENCFQFLERGTRPVYRLTTTKGYKVKATKDHEIQVFNERTLELEWKALEDVKIDDYLCISTKSIAIDRPLKLNLPEVVLHDKRMKNPIRPTHMTPDLAMLLGLIASDGSVRGDGVHFGNSDLRLHKKVRALVNKLFGLDVQTKLMSIVGDESSIRGVKFSRNVDFYNTDTYSIVLAQWMAHLGFATDALNKRVPWSILEADTRSQQAFLAGYIEGDGSIRPERISFYSASPKSLNGLQVILQNLGIISNQVQRVTSVGGAALDVYGEFSDKLYVLLRPYLTIKRRRGKMVRINTSTYGIPNAGLLNIIKSRKAGGVRSKRPEYKSVDGPIVKWTRGREGKGSLVNTQCKVVPYVLSIEGKLDLNMLAKVDSALADRLKALMAAGYYFDHVRSIEYVGKRKVYDINVRDKHSFVANGIVVHNCLGQRSGKSVSTSMAASYVTHRLLKMQRPTMVYGLLPDSLLTMTFVGLTFQRAFGLLWTPFHSMLSNAPWFCIAEGEQVSMADSTTKPIENIQVGDEVKTLEGTSTVTNIFDNGHQECNRVSLVNGNTLEGTDEHQVRCLAADRKSLVWKNISELTEDDYVVTEESCA